MPTKPTIAGPDNPANCRRSGHGSTTQEDSSRWRPSPPAYRSLRTVASPGTARRTRMRWSGLEWWLDQTRAGLKRGLSQAWQPLAIGLGSRHMSVVPKLPKQSLPPRWPHRHDRGCLHRPCGTRRSDAARLHAQPEASNWWTLVWAWQPNLCRLHRGHRCVGRLHGSPARATVAALARSGWTGSSSCLNRRSR